MNDKPLLHNERWRELEPEFLAAAALRQALDALTDVKVHSPGSAHCKRLVEQALTKLHPVTRDPKGWDELEQRKAGTFTAGGTVAPPAPDLLARVRELEGLVARLQAAPPSPATPPSPEPDTKPPTPVA